MNSEECTMIACGCKAISYLVRASFCFKRFRVASCRSKGRAMAGENSPALLCESIGDYANKLAMSLADTTLTI